jgi:hypothetical protein
MSSCGGVPVDGVVSDWWRRSIGLATRLVNCRLLVMVPGVWVDPIARSIDGRACSSPAKSSSHEQGHQGPGSARVMRDLRPLLSGHQPSFPHPARNCRRRLAGKLLDLGPMPSGQGGPRVGRRSSGPLERSRWPAHGRGWPAWKAGGSWPTTKAAWSCCLSGPPPMPNREPVQPGPGISG